MANGNDKKPITKEDIRYIQKQLELEREISEILKERGINEKDYHELTQKQLKLQETELHMSDESLNRMSEKIAKMKEIERAHENTKKSLEGEILFMDQTIERINEQLYLNSQLAKAGKISVQEALNLNRELEHQKEVLEATAEEQAKYTITVKDSVSAAKDLATAFGGVLSVYAANPLFNYDNMIKFGQSLMGAKGGLIAMASTIASVGLKAFVDSVISLALTLDQAESAFRRTTGASAAMAREMTHSYEATRENTVSAQQNQEAWGALYSTYTDFTMISEEARAEIGQTTAILTQLGVTGADSAKGIQIADKMMGQVGVSAAATLRELSSLAENIGVAPGQLIAQYGQIGPSLAKLGADGTKAFKDLARVSKITGLEIQKLLAITDKFDTFEGAATSAGKLNAALGGNFVNAMDLMMATDPVERFEMLRGALDEAGLSFDEMSYYQRKFYADSLGLDSVGDLALMMSGNMEALGAETQQTSADYAKAAERAAEMASVQESLKAVLQSLIPVLLPLLQQLQALGNWLVKHIDTVQFVVKYVGGAIVVYKTWKTVTMLYTKALAAQNMTSITQIGLLIRWRTAQLQVWLAQKKALALAAPRLIASKLQALASGAMTLVTNALTWATTANTASGIKGLAISALQKAAYIILIPLKWGLAAAQWALAAATGATTLQWVLFAAAVALVAFAIMASIHSPPLYLVLPIVAAGLWLMSFALSAVAPAAAAAAIPLLGVGVAIALVGAGVALAGLGFLLLAKGMTLIFEALDVEKIKAFGAFVVTLAKSAFLLPLAAIGMAALGYGLLSVAFALKFIATKDLEAIATFSESLASIQSGQLLETAKAIKQVAKAMDDIPTKKAITFRTILERVEASANAVSRAGGATAYGAATGGARGAGGGGGAAPAAAAPRTNQQVTVKLELDGKLLEEKVLNIVDGKFAEAS